MLFVDRRIGSADLLPLLTPLGVPAELTTLPFADAALVGRGEAECSVPIGVELKTIGDLLSSMTSGRLAGHQLPGLLTSYDWIWIVVEGVYRPSPVDGVLEVLHGGYWHPFSMGTRRFMYRDVESFLMTLTVKGQVHVAQTTTRAHTARWLGSLYHWWTDKRFDEHRSHLALHRKASAPPGDFIRPSLVRRIAAELPGIGWERSGAIAARFATVRELVEATPAVWAEIDGIGKKLAKQIVEAVQ